ncbi:MAG TPA: glycoside hydrolase family 3 N-terminal domain-containing protein [Cyclobacteriaceae bacterium]|nr:glycoside hydrolase family 3 protein [Cyclobacteriaceae bacterium]HMV07710.1 glycoside hydrolase family 3 N-terminal domain-containing protein [Cyclobacteriaceae bacterium]HMV88511.1 glycoside hydrolase family 3 N-terminal domain-containing protein [Cyclobacteriaceae bacterium]HMW98845.1 glycoside hydrolase family 3 N-terminal domain-containing protein [Cyclobacteriaceae bacterium]HMX48522.1 glycoside hydrolase family 3 N-terminal domain-containing protein [Cyclobacteriaceae bacterium]
MNLNKRFFCLITFLTLLGYAQAQTIDSLDVKIGQMILIGFPGSKVDDKVLEEIRQGKVGSIIIFEKNIPAKNSYAELKKITWTYQHAAPIPLFISIDQEGGKVNRLKEKYGFPRSVTAARLGKFTPDSVQFYAETTAATLAGLGINVNFAPVVDLAIDPNNPAIVKPERAFSAQEDSVALFAREVIRQHRKLGIISVLKHFPGHGSSKDDTHLGIADVTNTWNVRELYPYRSLIDSGEVDAIMTAHIVNKKLDPKGNPGTLSKKVIDSLLRKQFHYDGVVFSDDMQMHAITKHYGLEEAIRMAINAGVDILTFSNNISGSQERTVDKVHEIIKKFVVDGTISKARIDQSYKRIMNLKRQLNGGRAEYYRISLAEKQLEINALKDQNEQALKNAQAAFEKAEAELKKVQATTEQKKEKKRKRNKD